MKTLQSLIDALFKPAEYGFKAVLNCFIIAFMIPYYYTLFMGSYGCMNKELNISEHPEKFIECSKNNNLNFGLMIWCNLPLIFINLMQGPKALTYRNKDTVEMILNLIHFVNTVIYYFMYI